MQYDDASWHEASTNGEEAQPNAGAVHIGMFLAWAIYRGLSSTFHMEELEQEAVKLQNREFTPGQYVNDFLDGKFSDEDLNEEGNAFAQTYYRDGAYMDDYLEVLCPSEEGDLCAVADTWENFDAFYPRIDQRYLEWKSQAS